MARFHILKWLYKHSPLNFYSVTDDGATIIKSVNNTNTGYKYEKQFDNDEISSVRKRIKHHKRITTVVTLFLYLILLYLVVFPNYSFFKQSLLNVVLFIIFVCVLTTCVFVLNSKIFEKYLISKFGDFEKTIFPASNSIEVQSYKDFKIELVKIFSLFLLLAVIYFVVGSPFKKALDLVHKAKYDDAIKFTTLCTKILPIDYRFYSIRGYAKFYTQDLEGAISDFEKAYELENDDYRTINFDNKIYVKYFVKDYDGIIEDFDSEIKKLAGTPEQIELEWDKAQFLYNIGKYKQALEIYNKLILDSDDDKIYLLKDRLYAERALVHKKLGMEKEYAEDLENSGDNDLLIVIPKPEILLQEL